MAKFCRECGKELRDDASFCGGCGTKTAAAPQAVRAAAPIGAPQTLHPPVIPKAGGFRASAPPPPPGSVPTIPPAAPLSPGPPIPQAYAAPIAELSESASSLVLKGRELAARLHKSVPPTTQMGAILDKSIRAAFLDPEVYRQAALDPKQNMDAGIVAAVSLFCAAAGPALLGVVGGNLNLTWMIGLLLAQVAGFAAFVYGAAFSASFAAGVKVDPLALFRSVAWGQAVGVLGILPVVGSLISLWRIPTTVVAIRDGLGLDMTKAITLAVIGAVCGAVAATVLTPIIFMVLGGGRGIF